jgi:O-antigen/teichoic acid export membrane protein
MTHVGERGAPVSAAPRTVRSADATRVQIRGSTLLLAGQVFALAANLATQVLLVRYLSKTDYGAFAYGLSVVAIGETVAALGLRRGVSQFMPMYEERGEQGKAAGLLVFSLATVLGVGLAVMLMVIGFRGLIAGSLAGRTEAATLLAILIALVPIHAIEYLLDAVYSVFARPKAILARKYVYAPIMRLLVVGLLVLSGSGVTFVAVGYVTAGVLGIVVYASLLVGVLRAHGLTLPIRSRRLMFPIREVLSYSLPLVTHDISAVLLTSMGTILVGAMRNASEVAQLRAVLPVALTLSYVLASFGVLFAPLASRLRSRGAAEELNQLYWQTAAWTGVFSLPVFLLGSLFAHQLTVFLFGVRYADAADVLAVLTVGYVVTTFAGPNGMLLAVFGEVRFVVWTNIAAVVINVGLSVLLIASYGALGAAIAVSITYVLLNASWQIGLARRTDVRGFDRRYVRLYVLFAAVTAGLAAVQVVLSPPLAIAIVLVVAAWLGVLLGARRLLTLGETFAELSRFPLLRRLVQADEARPGPTP